LLGTWVENPAQYNPLEPVTQPLLRDTEDLLIVIPAGFYTGTELAAAITLGISGECARVGIATTYAPTVTYDMISNRFTFVAPTTYDGNQVIPNLWVINSKYTFPIDYTANNALLGKDILSIMGYSRDAVGTPAQSFNYVWIDASGNKRNFTSGSAPLTFTQYIDICSPQLCKFQEFPGGSTTNLARRGDVICRLYISNNVATQEEEGQRPFVINRQYNNARIMGWTAGNSIGTIDINLYDDVGAPLQITWLPRNYAITFNVYEMEAEEGAQTTSYASQVMGAGKGGHPHLASDMPFGGVAGGAAQNVKYGAYQPVNKAAWNSSSFPISHR